MYINVGYMTHIIIHASNVAYVSWTWHENIGLLTIYELDNNTYSNEYGEDFERERACRVSITKGKFESGVVFRLHCSGTIKEMAELLEEIIP